jgi:uncharacterized membrane protein
MTSTPALAARAIDIHSVDPGRSVGWWAEAWTQFQRNALLWVALGVALMVTFGLLGSVPLVGALVTALLSPLLLGGWMLSARQAQGGAALEARGLLAGFRGVHLKPLLTLGAWLAAATLLIYVLGTVFGVSAVLGDVAIDTPADPAAHTGVGTGMLVLLLLLAFSMLVTAALWFAPALVVLHQATPWRAVRASLRAVLDNALTFLLYAVIQLLLAAVASLAYSLGWLLLLPVMLLTAYVSYCEVFESK